MILPIKNLGKAVEDILAADPECRDNDRKLMLKIWASQNPSLKKYDTFLMHTFALSFIDGLYVSPTAIARARRKIQERRPQYRGNYYHGRQNKAKGYHQEQLGIFEP